MFGGQSETRYAKGTRTSTAILIHATPLVFAASGVSVFTLHLMDTFTFEELFIAVCSALCGQGRKEECTSIMQALTLRNEIASSDWPGVVVTHDV
jgi:hypothetical protein